MSAGMDKLFVQEYLQCLADEGIITAESGIKK
jgi:hypothetical protein